jgi:lysophospholipase L1-like esterase
MATFGKVVAQFATFVVDAGDADETPDFSPLKGRVTFTPNTDRIIDNGPLDAVVMGSSPIVAILDDQGYLSTPAAGTQSIRRGIWLPATDNPQMNPTRFQYNVSYELYSFDDRPISIPSHIIDMPGNTTLNLARVVPPASAPSIGTSAAEAAAAIATDALLRAVRTINGVKPDAQGNVIVTGGGTSAGGLVTSVDGASGDILLRGKYLQRHRVHQGLRTIGMGDSIMKGSDGSTSGHAGSWLSILAGLSFGAIKMVRNSGVPGNTTAQMLARYQTDVLAYRPDMIVLEVITPNDTAAKGITNESIRANIKSMVEQGLAIGARVVVCTGPPQVDDAVNARMIENSTWLRTYAATLGLDVWDLNASLVNSSTGKYKDGYSADGTHPVMLANDVLAQDIWAKVNNDFLPGGILATATDADNIMGSKGLFLAATSDATVADGIVGPNPTTGSTMSRVAREDGLGFWQYLTNTTAGPALQIVNMGGIRQPDNSWVLSWLPGDVFAFSGEYENISSTTGFTAQVNFQTPAGTSQFRALSDWNPVVKGKRSFYIEDVVPANYAGAPGNVTIVLGAGMGTVGYSRLRLINISALERTGRAFSPALNTALNMRPTFDQAGVELAKRALLVHSHDAADVTSGVLAAARLALTSANQIPMRDAAGAVTAVSLSSAASVDTAVRRTSSGTINTATATATTEAVPLAQMTSSLGLKADATALTTKADLVNGVIPTSQIPALALSNVVTVASQAAMLALTSTQVQPGDFAIRTDESRTYILTNANPSVIGSWTPLLTPSGSAGSITSVNGQMGVVVLGKGDIGLANVDNTSDAAKPISTATATALNDRVTLAAFNSTVTNLTDNIQSRVLKTDYATYQGQVSTSFGARPLYSEIYTRDYMDNQFATLNNQPQLDALSTRVDGKATIKVLPAGTTSPPSLTEPNTLLFVRKA